MSETIRDQKIDPLLANHNRFTRRMMLGSMAGAASVATLAGCQSAGQDTAGSSEQDVFNSWDRTKSYQNNEMDSGEPWVAPKHGDFDLSDPFEANLARLKISGNLVGERTYCAMVLRAIAAGSDDPGGVMFGGYTLFTWQLQKADPAEFPWVPEGTVVQRSVHTAVYVHPETMEPVSEVLNPLTGQMMELDDYLFVEQFLWFPNGGVGFVEEPEMFDDAPNKPNLAHVKPWGDEIVLSGDGIYSNPGLHQPRFTMVNWRAPRKHIMDSNSHLDTATYSHYGLIKAYEKPWTGFTPQDDIVMGTQAIGKKMHRVEDIPDTHKRLILEKYPDRI